MTAAANIFNRSAFALVALAMGCALAAWPARAAERVALLIGNNQYASTPLRNAANDAKDLGDALKDLGFKVILRENASRKDMIDGIREFGQALEGANTALFFYAGHAMQFKDRNYLIPIDAAMGSEEDVTFFSVEVGQVLCIVEAMKLMNEIECDVAGEVVKKLVSNGQPIEYGQELFAIRPKK